MQSSRPRWEVPLDFTDGDTEARRLSSLPEQARLVEHLPLSVEHALEQLAKIPQGKVAW